MSVATAEPMAELWDDNRTEPEGDYVLTNRDGDQFAVFVEKVGGGSLGEEYVGSWRVEIQNSQGDIVVAGEYRSLFPHTHEEVAETALEFLAE